MPVPPAENLISRPSACPYCSSRAVETLAKELTRNTMWRCRGCDRAWTMAQLIEQRRRALSAE